MVEQKLPKLTTRVRFPSPAPRSIASLDSQDFRVVDTYEHPATRSACRGRRLEPKTSSCGLSLGNSLSIWRWARWPAHGCRDSCATSATATPRSAGIGRPSSFPPCGRSIAGSGSRAGSWRRCRSVWRRSSRASIPRCTIRRQRGSLLRRRRRLGRAGHARPRSPPTRCSYRRVKHEVRRSRSRERAEGRGGLAVCARAAARRRSPRCCSAAPSLALLWTVTVPELDVLHEQHVVRANVAAGLAAVRAAAAAGRGAVGAHAARFRADPITPRSRRSAARHSSTSVDLSPKTGRVRIALGPASGAVAGKALLLAPAIDARAAHPLVLHRHRRAGAVPAAGLPQPGEARCLLDR